jgi:cob(I)alamin adenosyltransferase
MVKLNKIYTRTGDDGTTGLGNGERRLKNDRRVAAYGDVDEANCAIGLARLAIADAANADLALIEATLARAQNDLFDLGADLCVPETKSAAPGGQPALRVTMSQVDQVEQAIDRLNTHLAPLRSFVLPGGERAAGALHLARAICRRAERKIVELAATPGEIVGAPALAYINRLSDYLFVAARFANDRGAADVLWVPGANQSAQQ